MSQATYSGDADIKDGGIHSSTLCVYNKDLEMIVGGWEGCVFGTVAYLLCHFFVVGVAGTIFNLHSLYHTYL